MLQASNTRLLHSKNFVSIGDNDKVYNTTPEGLEELIQSVYSKITTNDKIPTLDYLSICNYCKWLILNPAINTFNLNVNDILLIWEIRLVCMFLFRLNEIPTNSTSHSTINKPLIINDKMLQFEASNIIEQVNYLNLNKNPTNLMNPNNNNINSKNSKNDNNSQRKQIKLKRQFENLIYYLKFNGRELPLLEHYYKQVFKSRTIKEQDQEYLNRLEFAILSVLIKRNELITVFNIIEMEDDEINSFNKDELDELKLIKDKIEKNDNGIEYYCFGISLSEDDQNHLYSILVQTLISKT